MSVPAVTQFRSKRIVVYNDDGTVNLPLTRLAGPRILEATLRVEAMVAELMEDKVDGLCIETCVEDVRCSAADPVVFWRGMRLVYRGKHVFSVQFACTVSQGTFPVKATESGDRDVYFNRRWPRLSQYVDDVIGGIRG